MIAEHPKTILMTGATGFLGHSVLRDLLLRKQRMVVLLRPPLAESSARLSAMLRDIGLDLASYVEAGQALLVEGTLPDDLPKSDWGSTDAILNCAASLQVFSNGNGDPFRTNVAGTEAVIDWAHQNKVKNIYAISTAYTCGWNKGVIKEAFHHPAPEFQTDYEKSKWTAESLLEQWSEHPDHKVTILRPSFLVGDSNTGRTTQFVGFYQFLRLIAVLKERYRDPNNGQRTYIPLRIPGRPDDVQNIVPVDFVARIIAEVVIAPRFHGRVYHLTNPEPPTNDMMKRYYEEYFGLHGGYFAEPEEVLNKCSPAESLLWDEARLVTPRVAHTPLFDITNTREVMKAAGIIFPVLNRDRIMRLFDYARNCGWGRDTNGPNS